MIVGGTLLHHYVENEQNSNHILIYKILGAMHSLLTGLLQGCEQSRGHQCSCFQYLCSPALLRNNCISGSYSVRRYCISSFTVIFKNLLVICSAWSVPPPSIRRYSIPSNFATQYPVTGTECDNLPYAYRKVCLFPISRFKKRVVQVPFSLLW